MYFRTTMFTAFVESPYRGLVENPKIEFTLKHDPSKLTYSGRMTLRTWMRAGYCNSPNGALGARWRLLMAALKAHYLMEQSSSRGFGISPIMRTGIETDHSEQYANINALALLSGAANSRAARIGPLSFFPSPEKFNFDRWGKIETVFRQPYEAGFYVPNDKFFLKAAVRELGHPLGDKGKIAEGLACIDRLLEFRVTAFRDQGDHGGRHYIFNFQQEEPCLR
jgi:hypothetical protein